MPAPAQERPAVTLCGRPPMYGLLPAIWPCVQSLGYLVCTSTLHLRARQSACTHPGRPPPVQCPTQHEISQGTLMQCHSRAAHNFIRDADVTSRWRPMLKQQHHQSSSCPNLAHFPLPLPPQDAAAASFPATPAAPPQLLRPAAPQPATAGACSTGCCSCRSGCECAAWVGCLGGTEAGCWPCHAWLACCC